MSKLDTKAPATRSARVQRDRADRTRETLRQTLIQLITTQHLSSLSVQQLTQRAGVHRTTFYGHYSGLPELLEDCARNVFDEWRARIRQLTLPITADEATFLTPIVEASLLHIHQHRAFYRAVVSQEGDPALRNLFHDFLMELALTPLWGWDSTARELPWVDLTASYYAAGFAGIVAWWLDTGQPGLTSAIAERISRDLLSDYRKRLARAAAADQPTWPDLRPRRKRRDRRLQWFA